MRRRDDAGLTTVLNVDLKGDVAKLDVWWLGGPIGSFSCLQLGLLIWFWYRVYLAHPCWVRSFLAFSLLDVVAWKPYRPSRTVWTASLTRSFGTNY
jgi:hypothetical protein